MESVEARVVRDVERLVVMDLKLGFEHSFQVEARQGDLHVRKLCLEGIT